MVQLINILVTLLAASASSALAKGKSKSIGQKIADSTRPWEQACVRIYILYVVTDQLIHTHRRKPVVVHGAAPFPGLLL